MRAPARLSVLLRTSGFSLHGRVGALLGVGIVAQSLWLGLATAGLLIGSAALSGALHLDGTAVGLFEHPTIWTLIAIQIATPITLAGSLRSLVRARGSIVASVGNGFSFRREISEPLSRFATLQGLDSRTTASLFFVVGIIAFVWNSYQNQRPDIFLPHDVWDSATFPLSYWLTRLYKVYLYCWFLPYAALLHAGVLWTVLRVIRRARVEERLVLLPFHRDRSGGLGFIPSLVTSPIVSTLLLTSIATGAAFWVHKAFDFTPMIGIALVAFGASVGYVLPMTYLRSDIVAVKARATDILRARQQTAFAQLMEPSGCDPASVRTASETVSQIDGLCDRITRISNYPHLGRFAGSAGLAMMPAILSGLLKALLEGPPFLDRVRSLL